MKTSFLSYLNYGTEYCSIEHSVAADDSLDIRILTATKKNGEFVIRNTFHKNTVEDIPAVIENNQHCFLNISGSNVLLKSASGSGNDSKIISSAFPNIDLNEFYYQILKTSTQSFVAVCRKDYIQSILNIYKKNKIEVVRISLDFFTIQNLISSIKEEKIQLLKYSLFTSKGEIVKVEKNEPQEEKKIYEIEDSTINSDFLVPLAGLFSYNNFPFNVSSNINELNQTLRKDHRQKVIFRKGLAAGTGILFTALLINFFLFTGYYEEYQNLNQKYEAELLEKQLNEQKFFEIREKEKLVKNILNNSGSRSSFFINRIIAENPPTITLNEFTYQPLDRQIKENDPIELIENTIKISGESTDESSFSTWIKALEEIPWVEGIKVADYSFKSEQISAFIITVTIKDI